ncbi:unnamed protein product [Rotaria sp. Silwood1]|nr:unnamed protein product [Rotaria sp. Silwood1]CAF1364874.1 unnamed protein product [Rotaria sp. Silwood1]
MAGTYHTEEQRIIDRIKCIAFREARDAGATFINRHWVAKKVHHKGESWTGQYFRDIILTEHVFPFLKNEENVIDPDEVIFAHGKAPCMRAYQTQHLLQDNDVKFWGNDIWPGNSPDLNMAEHIGTIIKDEVEKKMLSEPGHSRYLDETTQNAHFRCFEKHGNRQ